MVGVLVAVAVVVVVGVVVVVVGGAEGLRGGVRWVGRGRGSCLGVVVSADIGRMEMGKKRERKGWKASGCEGDGGKKGVAGERVAGKRVEILFTWRTHKRVVLFVRYFFVQGLHIRQTVL